MTSLLVGLAVAHCASPPAGTVEPHWIWPGSEQLRKPKAELVHTFHVTDAKVSRAEIRLVADFQRSSVLLNGHLIARLKPFTGLVAGDVTRFLKSGKNVIRTSGVRTAGVGPAALACELAIRFENGKTQTVVSAPQWRVHGKSTSTAVQDLGPADLRFFASDSRHLAIAATDDYTQWKRALGAKSGTDPVTFQSRPDFSVELVRSAGPKEGSWIALEFDPQGRLLIGREDRGILRLTLSPDGRRAKHVETFGQKLQEIRGLLCAHDSLYVQANSSLGLFRLQDTDGDDRFDKTEQLYHAPGGKGHGRNDLTLGPRGHVYAIFGDSVQLPPPEGDTVFPTSPLREHRQGKRTREGHVVAFSAGGKRRELFCAGLRNPFGIAFNRHGEAFTYDADAEYDMGSPWYRPTRVQHLRRGADFRWRGVTRRWPPYYPDSPEAAPHGLTIGRGSPTAVKFATGDNFPPPYDRALFILDWAYGRVLAVHLRPRGASYIFYAEHFLRGQPLNVTDLAFGPNGAMYFVTGGRKTQSGLYRVSYSGPPVEQAPPTKQQLARAEHAKAARTLRHRLESLFTRPGEKSLEALWPHLGSFDPAIRYAARTSLEHHAVETWCTRGLKEPNSRTALAALQALARTHDPAVAGKILNRCLRFNWESLSTGERIELLHICRVAHKTAEKVDGSTLNRLREFFEPRFPYHGTPTEDASAVNRELCSLLVLLDSLHVVPRTLDLLEHHPLQPTRMHYLFALRGCEAGWTPPLRRRYFKHLAAMRHFRGGQGMPTFVAKIQADALAAVPTDKQAALKALLHPAEEESEPAPPPKRPFVRKWTIKELLPSLADLEKPRNLKRGQAMFAAAQCIRCHRAGLQGAAVGPDLTSASRRFSGRDLLTSIIKPSEVVADPYQSDRIITAQGRTLTGRIVPGQDYRSPTLKLDTDPLSSGGLVELRKADIESHTKVAVSPMPEGLLNTLSREEILDLLGYLRSLGRPDK